MQVMRTIVLLAAFLIVAGSATARAPQAVAEIAELGPEADREKGAGRTRDADRDPAHYLDLGDDGTIGGTLALAQLPPTRAAYDTALRASGSDQYAVGYVPYEIVEGYELVVNDFAIWRVDTYGERHGSAADRAWFAADCALRETLTLRDIGFWGHFVADASQPLHVSVHFNGWGDFPNPDNYTQSHDIHAFFESDFVNAHANPQAVLAKMPPYAASSTPVMARVEAYLAATNAHVPDVYRLWGAGAFATATPAAVGYPEYRVRDVLDGAVAPEPGRVDAGG
jgi:hypothetical protein